MSVLDFNDLLRHYGHEISVTKCEDLEGNIWNVAIECHDCSEVLLDFDHPDIPRTI